MAFRQFCCKKKKWRWLATQNHAKLVYYIVHTETKSSKEIVHWSQLAFNGERGKKKQVS